MVKWEKYTDEAVRMTRGILEIPSPTGMTSAAGAWLVAVLEDMGYKPELTRKGSVKVCLGGEGETRVLAAHVDTLGAMVRAVKGNGRLRLTRLGSYAEATVEGENCTVHTREGKTFSGTLQLNQPSLHVTDAARTSARDDSTMEVVLDELTRSAEDTRKLGISAGDFISFDPRTVVTPSGFIKSRHLDDKASAGILLSLARWVKEEAPVLSGRLWLLFTTYEEVGHGGAAGLPEDTAEFVSVDMGCVGDDLGADETMVSICAKDGSGPYDESLTHRLIQLARREDLAYAVDIYPHYSSDASVVVRAGYDVRHGLIGPGVYASHGYERTHRQGIEQTLRLLAAYVSAEPA